MKYLPRTAALRGMHRNIAILSAGQALGLAGAPFVVLVGTLAGQDMAPVPGLATLPVATVVVGTALTSIPAAMIMKRVGRRIGFMIGALCGIGASLLGAWAIASAGFLALCLATTGIGAANAFVVQYRFAAAESVESDRAGVAISIVLLGGVAAGFIGPETARLARGWILPGFAGAFLALAVIYAALVILLILLDDVAPVHDPAVHGTARPLRQMIPQPEFALAVIACVIGFGTMSFIMTATPLSMRMDGGHSVDATAHVIQAHVAAMYLPSLFAGPIVARLGPRGAILTGIVVLAGCVTTAASSQAVAAYTLALVLLGVGWNFIFVGGTVLLTRSYLPAERFRAQAANDFMIFGTQAVASLSAGAALRVIGWRYLNLAALPFLAALFLLTFLLRAPVLTRS